MYGEEMGGKLTFRAAKEHRDGHSLSVRRKERATCTPTIVLKLDRYILW